jgi:glucose-6-phosphate isomerase
MYKSPDFGKVSTAHKTRFLTDMADVLLDQTWVKKQPNRALYEMYREVHLSKKDLEKMKNASLRYDITVIPAGMLGPEFVKTAGHYHPSCQEFISYPEVYQVIRGTATYLLQKDDLTDFIVVTARDGEVVLIPPNYGHVTVNAYDSELVMANWVSDVFQSDYEPIRKKAGLAYYWTDDGFVKNKNYDQIPELKYKKPKSYPKVDLYSGEDMYGLIENLDKLDFLNNPINYPDLFKKSFY